MSNGFYDAYDGGAYSPLCQSVNCQGESRVKTIQDRIYEKCDHIRKILINKNKDYGNSAISPVRIFSKSDALEGILVRCDDKISRIQKTGVRDKGEDQVIDLVGYLILLSIHLDMENELKIIP